MCKLWKGVQKNIRKISIVDRFLMVFMLILFVYTIVQIFMGVAASQDDNTVGVIVRTSLASIFGYFISSNFAGGRSPSSSKTSSVQGRSISSEFANSDPSSRIKNQIGFESSPKGETGGISLSENSSLPVKHCSKVQVCIVAAIGLVSLVILVVTKQFPEATAELAAMKSQLRDFTSACIGFLVSCGKQE